jgi:hypothetical protein
VTLGWICIMLLIVHGSPTNELNGPGGGREVGAGEEFLCADIAGGGEWESLTSLTEDDDGEDLYMADTDEDDVTADARATHVPRGGTCVSNVEEKYDVDDGGDVDPTTQTGDHRVELRRLALVRKLHS